MKSTSTVVEQTFLSIVHCPEGGSLYFYYTNVSTVTNIYQVVETVHSSRSL